MKVLIVATYFPPHATVAVVRVSSFARHLLQKGYEIHVLTGAMPERATTPLPNGLEGISSITEVSVNPTANYYNRSAAYAEAFRRCMQTQHPDCVFITCGTYETVPLCEICHREFHTRCVLDYRDLWIFDQRRKREFFKPTQLMRKIMFYPTERRALAAADAVVTVTDGWGDILRRAYPKSRDKVHIVYNGYDDLLFSQITEADRAKAQELLAQIPNRAEALVLASFGKLIYYSYQHGKVLFTAAKELLQQYPSLVILHIGEREKRIDALLAETGFPADHFICTGLCPYQIGMELLKSADCNLLIDLRKQAIGTKIYDYIYVNRPVLYCGAMHTYLSELVVKFSGGFVCEDVQDVVHAVQMLAANRSMTLTAEADTKTYSRTLQNERLEKLLHGNP